MTTRSGAASPLRPDPGLAELLHVGLDSADGQDDEDHRGDEQPEPHQIAPAAVNKASTVTIAPSSANSDQTTSAGRSLRSGSSSVGSRRSPDGAVAEGVVGEGVVGQGVVGEGGVGGVIGVASSSGRGPHLQYATEHDGQHCNFTAATAANPLRGP